MRMETKPVMSNALAGWRARALVLAATVATALLAACGGSGTGAGSPSTAAANGAALVTIQDAAGDFLSYTVDLSR